MQITLRSHLIAGTAAVVGAGAIAMTPVTAAHLNLSNIQVPSMAQVALAGFDSPLSELISTGILGGNYLFDGGQDPTDPASWPFSGIADGTGLAAFVWPGALASEAAGGYSSVGLVPQIIDDALPIISQLGYNGSDYLQAAITGLGGAAYILSEGVWNAIGDVLTLNIPSAIQTLVAAVQDAGSLALSAGGYVVANVLAKASAAAKFVIGDLPVLVASTFKQIQVLVKSLIAVPKNVIAAFGQPKPIEGAWNAAVDGLLGPSGVPGTALNLTIGAGVQTGTITGNSPATVEASIAANFVPSIRTEVQAATKGIANALKATPSSAASVKAGASRAAKSAAAVEAPSAAAVASDAPEASAPVKASADNHTGKHRAARGAAARGAAS